MVSGWLNLKENFYPYACKNLSTSQWKLSSWSFTSLHLQGHPATTPQILEITATEKLMLVLLPSLPLLRTVRVFCSTTILSHCCSLGKISADAATSIFTKKEKETVLGNGKNNRVFFTAENLVQGDNNYFYTSALGSFTEAGLAGSARGRCDTLS